MCLRNSLEARSMVQPSVSARATSSAGTSSRLGPASVRMLSSRSRSPAMSCSGDCALTIDDD
jgi:hypothetical protein